MALRPSSTSVVLRRVTGTFGLWRRRGLLEVELCPVRLAFILVDQYLKLGRELWIGRAGRQAFEEKGPLAQLVASAVLERLVVLVVHRAPRMMLPAMFAQSPS